jgi:radical SAM protein with 4Fe4S-binding SPASM domain
MVFERNKKIKTSVELSVLESYFSANEKCKTVCKAPAKALYFHPDGEVTPCCLTKGKYSYGKYPVQSIAEILKSESRKKHKQYLANNNLSLGCDVCENNLKIGNYTGVMAYNYKDFKLKSKTISRIDFELSHKCNFDCIMCERNKTDCNTIYGEGFLNEIMPFLRDLKYANFIGGEPFIIDIYYKIWDFIIGNNPNCIITVQTNASIISPRIKNLLSHPNFLVVLSLDAIDEEKYSIIRKNGNLKTFNENFRFFNAAMKNKGSKLQISVCPMRINRNDITDIIRFCNDNECKIYFNYVEYPDYLSFKQTPAKYLDSLVNYYRNELQDFKQETDNERENFEAFNGFINLLEYWYRESLDWEANAVTVSKADIISLLKEKVNPDYLDVLLNALINAPHNWLIHNKQYELISTFDFNNAIEELIQNGLLFEEVVIKAQSFLNLNRIINITDE